MDTVPPYFRSQNPCQPTKQFVPLGGARNAPHEPSPQGPPPVNDQENFPADVGRLNAWRESQPARPSAASRS
jgi:hypothetical protein